MTSILRHPSAKAFERAIALILPSVEALAAFKQVEIEPAQYRDVARCALERMPHKMHRGLAAGEAVALEAAYLSIDHVLDVIAVGRLINISRSKSALPALSCDDVAALADHAVRNRSANDGRSSAIVWENPALAKCNIVGGEAGITITLMTRSREGKHG